MQITDFQYDSDEELYMAYWLTELEKVGLVISWTRNVPAFQLTKGLIHYYTKETILKTKRKLEVKEQALLKPSEYTPDFQIIWSSKAQGILFQTLYGNDQKITTPFIAYCEYGGFASIVESKPDFDQNNMTRLFKLNQKQVWDKYAVYVNLIHNSELFDKTFTPQARLYGKQGQERKITKWTARSIDSYLKTIGHDEK